MSVKIRLSRQGGKKKPVYRIVVAHSEAPRNGKFLEVVGTYNPAFEPVKVELNIDRVSHWIKLGAIPSETVSHLIKRAVKAKETQKAA